MTLLATPLDVGSPEEFGAYFDLTKTEVLPDGRRKLGGVASGTKVDEDGERMSKRALAKMAAQAAAGGLKATSSHVRDWATTFGDVVALIHEPERDLLHIETILPPEGKDPLADKAYHRAQEGGVGWSVAGKLRRAFFERDTDTGKRVKVLDDVDLDHVMLTERPAYSESFATVVAKTVRAVDEPDAPEWIEVDPTAEARDAVAIFKAAIADLQVTKDAASGMPGDRNAGTSGGKAGMDASAPGETDDDDDPGDGQDDAVPEVKRKLCCPNCGHEFAAPLPTNLDGSTGEDDDDHDEDDDGGDAATAKSRTEEADMSGIDKDLMAELRALTGTPEPEVAKTTAEPDPVSEDDLAEFAKSVAGRALAKSHTTTSAAIDELREGQAAITEALGTIAKSVTAIAEGAGAGTGRKSVARTGGQGLPTRAEVDNGDGVAKTRTANGGVLLKTVGDMLAAAEEAPDAETALKLMNRAKYGLPVDDLLPASAA